VILPTVPAWLAEIYESLDPAKPYIKTELLRFTGSPAFDANHTMFLPHPDPFDYNGNGPEVDEAWEKKDRR
jgi:hypothetical protein